MKWQKISPSTVDMYKEVIAAANPIVEAEITMAITANNFIKKILRFNDFMLEAFIKKNDIFECSAFKDRQLFIPPYEFALI